MNDDIKFNCAMHTYKNVVTHYLESKMETWFGLFFGLIFNVNNGLLSNKFSKTRGAMYYHSIFSSNNPFWRRLQSILFCLTYKIHKAMEELKAYIVEKWVKSQYEMG